MNTKNTLGLLVVLCAVFVGVTCFASPAHAFVGLYINGSRQPAPVAPGTTVTISWTSQGATACNTGVSPVPPTGWGQYVPKAPSGSQPFVIPAGGARFGIQCANTIHCDANYCGMEMEDWIAVATTTCTPNATKKCVGNSVYNFDSCGVQGSLFQGCNTGWTCTNSGTTASCVDTTPATSVNLKINGQDGIVTVAPGTPITLSWTSQGVGFCNTGTTAIPPWASNITKPVNGSETFIPTVSGTYGIQCSVNQSTNMITDDSVGVIISSTNVCTPACSSNQTCVNGSCVNNNPTLTASCAANPSTIQVGQSTSFMSSVTGGNGVYSYSWSGACQAGSQNCAQNFQTAGTYTSLLSVTSGGQAANTSCSVTVNPVSNTCTPACSSNQTCVNGSCVNNNTGTQASVTTNPASNIQANSATLNGNLNSTGSDSNAATWFQWGTASTSLINDTPHNTIVPGPMSATVALAPSTTYFFRAVAETGAGRVFGNVLSFTTLGGTNGAQVQTLSATSITTTSAVLNGQLNSLAGANSGQVFFEWGTTVGYGNPTQTQTQNNSGPFNQTIANLTPGTIYHFHACVITSAGKVCGNDSDFSTLQNNGGGGTSNLAVSCYAQPSSILTGQSTTFTSNVSGANNVYSYTWSGACNAGSQNCSATFSQTGTYTAILSVQSAGQTQSTSCSVAVNANTNTTTCTQNYQQKCVSGNMVYWFDSCNIQGAYVATCGSNQSCSNGTCVNNNNNNQGNIVCYSNFDCGGNSNNYSSSLVCQGNSVYQTSNYNSNYNHGTCVNPGTTSSYCSTSYNNNNNYNNNLQFLYSCTGNQYCYNGACVNQNNNNYNNNYNNYGNVIVTTQVRNLATGNLNWSTSVPANANNVPPDTIEFQITLQNNSGTTINNVMVRDNLPPNLIYNNNLMVDGVANGGNITYGVNIGSLNSYQTRTVTYRAQLAPAQNFGFGSTALNDSVSVTSDNGNTGYGSATVNVNRVGVLGATSVSTGLLTGNFWVDSFLLPLILALIALWAWQAGLLNTFGIAEWVGNKKAKKNEAVAQTKLQERIEALRKKENA